MQHNDIRQTMNLYTDADKLPSALWGKTPGKLQR